MTIIGPGLTLVGDPTFNSSLLAVVLHSGTPSACDELRFTANALGYPVLYVHTHGYSHPEMTVYNTLRKLSSNFLAGMYEPWIQVSLESILICDALMTSLDDMVSRGQQGSGSHLPALNMPLGSVWHVYTREYLHSY